MKLNLGPFLSAIVLLGVLALPAKADLKLCNNTTSSVNVAVGYKDKQGWATEGWWKAAPAACVKLLKGPLISRFYYVFAVDLDRKKGGGWGGKSMLCTNDKIFTIRGIDKCAERGYLKQGFFEVDTGDKIDWAVSLTGDKTTPPADGAEPDATAQPVPDATTPPAVPVDPAKTNTQ
jgi:uncharacterized membrane protein